MVSIVKYLFAAALAALCLPATCEGQTSSDPAGHRAILSWSALPQLPAPAAGTCFGRAGNALISAGGLRTDAGGGRSLTSRVNALTDGGNGAMTWVSIQSLPVPLAQSTSVAWNDQLLCLGGLTESGHTDEVLLLGWNDQELTIGELPSMPGTAAWPSGTLDKSVVYVAGGLQSASDTVATHNFWALDLAGTPPVWEVLPAWPGPPRYAASSVSMQGTVYLFGGIQSPGHAGSGQRVLSDAYAYTPAGGWRRLTDLPFALAVAPAVTYGSSHILLLGGLSSADQELGADLFLTDANRRRDILAYDTITDTWTPMGQVPMDIAILPAVEWAGEIVLQGGASTTEGTGISHYRATDLPVKARFGAVNYLVLGFYCVILVCMGLYFSRRKKSDADYFLAQGRIPWWAAGLSIFGTQLSAITFMAIPAKAYATDWVYILGQATIVLLAPVVIYVYLPFFRRLQVTTAYEYLESRFNLAVRLFGSVAFILLQLGRMGIVIFLPALALSAVTGLNIMVAILLMGLLSTFYTALGGIEAVIWSDVLQVVVLLGGALISLVVMASSVGGGVTGLVATAASLGKFHTFTWTWDHTTTSVWVVLVGYLLSNLIPYTADQTVVQRYMTTKDQKQAARSIWTNALLTIPAGLIFFSLGTALFVFYREHPASLEPAIHTDAIFPLFIVQHLPAGLAGLLIAGIFAAAMSSLDSSINSVAAAVVHDYYRRLIPQSTGQQRLRLAQRLTLGLGLLATVIGLLMASVEIKSLFDLFLELLGLFGGSLAGLFALGIFTRRANGPGALVGAGASVVVLFLVSNFTQAHFFLYAGIGILTCCAVGYVASLAISRDEGNLEGLTIYSRSRLSG